MLVSLHGQVQGLRGGPLHTAPIHSSTLREAEHASTLTSSFDMGATVTPMDHDLSPLSGRKLSQLLLVTAPCSRTRYDINVDGQPPTSNALPTACPNAD